MVCPKCKNAHPNVIDSRQESHLVNRRRWCADCGYRFSTVEISKDDYKQVLKLKEDMQRLETVLREFNKGLTT